MRAIVLTRYGPPDVLQLTELEKPAPKDNEVLVRIYATTVTAGDCEMRSLKFPLYFSLPMRIWLGFTKPRGIKVPGTELAGEIEAVGKEVNLFKVGDQVFGSSELSFGAYAEYICIPGKGVNIGGTLALKPANMTFEEAATVPFGGRDAIHFIRKANIMPGQKIVIVGAGGSIGTFAVQLARYFGTEVTAVDSTLKLDMLRSIGAEHVIDYTKEDFTNNGEIYDIIFDVAGKVSISRSKRSLKHNGTYLLANPKPSQLVPGLWTRMTSRKRVVSQTASHTMEDLNILKELIEAGKIRTVIDRRYALEQIVEAHRYVETGQKKGHVVIYSDHTSRTL
jgi:NADPH:quinone reductase-like Zn-dependent oxidoreductase